mgnify:FL=1
MALLEIGEAHQAIYASPSFYRIIGAAPENFPLPKPLYELIHPDDLTSVLSALQEGHLQEQFVKLIVLYRCLCPTKAGLVFVGLSYVEKYTILQNSCVFFVFQAFSWNHYFPRFVSPPSGLFSCSCFDKNLLSPHTSAKISSGAVTGFYARSGAFSFGCSRFQPRCRSPPFLTFGFS